MSFGWRKLHTLSAIEHRLDASGFVLLRMGSSDPPFTTMTKVRTGKGGFHEASLESRGFAWSKVGDGWALRARSIAPVQRAKAYYGEIAKRQGASAQIDPRFLLVTMACESMAPAPDKIGAVKAPRTEKGYPGRTGEGDIGDYDRDLLDWKASRGAHSSHGLMQTLIRTAVDVRPDLFEGTDPRLYRTILWSPELSIACGAAAIAKMLSAWPMAKGDPLAMRTIYASGGLHKDPSSRWGVVFYDELVPVSFLALWNELACIEAGSCAQLSKTAPARARSKTNTWAWLTLAFTSFALTAASSAAMAHHLKRTV